MTATKLEPTTLDEVAAAVADVRAEGGALEVRGGGSVLDRLPPRDVTVLSTLGVSGIVDHASEDLTVTVRAGTPVAELAETLAGYQQECPIEPAGGAGSTVGGRIATALAGPRQLGAGRVRDWVLRVRFVAGTGAAAAAGGVTVKDVTGFDLCRLLTGSWGTIGVLTEVTLKLRPIASQAAWFATSAPAPTLDALLFRPAALFTTRERTHVLLEGHPDDVAEQALLADLRPAEAPELPTQARASVDPARLGAFIAEAERPDLVIVAQDAVGVCHLDGPADALRATRAVAERLGGSVLVLDPSSGLPAFGAAGAPEPMAARVAAALDPDDALAPWRWQQ